MNNFIYFGQRKPTKAHYKINSLLLLFSKVHKMETFIVNDLKQQANHSTYGYRIPGFTFFYSKQLLFVLPLKENLINKLFKMNIQLLLFDIIWQAFSWKNIHQHNQLGSLK